MNTNHSQSRRLLHRALLLSNLLPWAAVACGGTSLDEPGRDKGMAGTAGQVNGGGGAGGSAAGSGQGGLAGNGGAAAGAAGNAGVGAAAGAGSGGNGGRGGSGGDGGNAGMGVSGSAGSSSVCHAKPPQVCASGPITLPRNCVPEAMASAGTSLPIATCKAMCDAFITFACEVSAVDATSVTVQCSSGCPAGGA